MLSLRYCNGLAFLGRPAGRQSCLRDRASPPPGDPGARPAAPGPGPARPRAPRPGPGARAGFLLKSSGLRGLRMLAYLRSASAPRHRRAVPGAPPAAPRPGPRGPGPDLQAKWTSRAPVAPGPGRVFKSSGRRGLRLLRARTSSPSRADVVDADASGPTSSPSRQPDAEPMLLVRGSPRHTDVAPAERAAQRVAALQPAESRGDHGARRGTASLPSGRHPAWSRRHGGRRGTLCPLARPPHGCMVVRRYCHLVV